MSKTTIHYTVEKVDHGCFQIIESFARYSEALKKARRLRGNARICERIYKTFERKTSLSSVSEVWTRAEGK